MASNTAGTDAQTSTVRETWRDWLPKDYPETALITRDDLLHELRQHGHTFGARRLQQLEAEGILPRPIRQSHPIRGTDETRPQSLYPAFYPHALAWFLEHRNSNATARGAFRFFANGSASPTLRLAWQRADATPQLPPHIHDPLTAYTRARSRSRGNRIAGARVELIDESGNVVERYEFTLPEKIGPKESPTTMEIGVLALAPGAHWVETTLGEKHD